VCCVFEESEEVVIRGRIEQTLHKGGLKDALKIASRVTARKPSTQTMRSVKECTVIEVDPVSMR
jgi:hypothetical protein